jgi:hypothetical protein
MGSLTERIHEPLCDECPQERAGETGRAEASGTHVLSSGGYSGFLTHEPRLPTLCSHDGGPQRAGRWLAEEWFIVSALKTVFPAAFSDEQKTLNTASRRWTTWIGP